MNFRAFLVTTVALLFVAAGCKDDGDDSVNEPDGGTDGWDGSLPEHLGGQCAVGEETGEFSVQLSVDFSSVSGSVKNGMNPADVLFPAGEVGECQLWRKEYPECDPPCQMPNTCDHDGTCVPYPVDQNVGTVTIQGLNKDVSMEGPGYFDTELPHPVFDPASPIRLDAAGGDYPAFTLYGSGVTPVELPDEVWVMREDTDLAVSWTPASDPHSFIQVTFNVDQHGNSPTTMFCIFDDTGSATVDGSLISDFLEAGVTGFSRVMVYRMTADSTQVGPGCVDLEVFSVTEGNLEVEGHIPCTGPNDCPDGLTCDLSIQTCV